jgi:hypothetical protein
MLDVLRGRELVKDEGRVGSRNLGADPPGVSEC